MTKLVRDGKIAVLISPGFGSGWFEEARFDAEIVRMLEMDVSTEDIKSYCKIMYPGQYLGGLYYLEVEWVTEGEYFYIHEYDGSEWIVNQGDMHVA